MEGSERIILGVDPGNAITGYGFIVLADGKCEPRGYHCGVIATPKTSPPGKRLKAIYDNLGALIEQFHPGEMAVEELFFNKNSKTALSVGEARGVVLLCAAVFGVPVFDYTPLQVKQAIAGYGRATKQQVSFMVKQVLGCQEKITPDDATDALAIALCHSFRKKTADL